MSDRGKRILKLLACLAAAALILFLAGSALARVGGGHSYGGGGGGGGDGDGIGLLVYFIVRFLLFLCIEYPAVGVPLTVVVIIVAVLAYRARTRAALELAETDTRREYLASRSGADIADAIAPLKEEDPNFSRPLFMDFVQLLYVRFHQSRGRGDLEPLRAYLAPPLFATEQEQAAQARRNGLGSVKDIVIGASDIVDVRLGRYNHITVLFESNIVEEHPENNSDWHVVETWTLRRTKGALSKGIEGMRSLDCPGCGASSELDVQGRCRYCGRNMVEPHFQWQIESIKVNNKQPRQRLEMGSGGGVEAGTLLPTLFAPDLAAQRKAFAVRRPEFCWDGFKARVETIFTEAQKAWSEKQWGRARPYFTDHVFNSNRYWVEQYKRDRLTNKVEQVKVEKIEPAKIEKDAFYDAITVRLWAQCLDYTVDDATGRVVSGSKRKPRVFTEYWTLIRRVGAGDRDPDAAGQCPSCGAPLQINMAGVCEYCSAHVSSGEFDWVVGGIQQDEAYRG